MQSEISYKEKRIRSIVNIYYSNPEVQKTIFEFSKNREVIPRYFEGFGKRPDAFQYPSEIYDFAKKGATSFHCSEELWEDPLQIETGMNEKQMNEHRIGWDLLIDIDSKYLDYSKVCAQIILSMLKFHGVKNIGIKFSGSKGFHLLIPWKAFPKEINNTKTSDMFPEWPRIITKYIMEKIKPKLIEKITELSKPNKYVKDYQAPKEVMPDLILVSPRHLFRAPYSLHEKTALASIVLSPEELENFEIKNADPLKIKIKSFVPDCDEGDASELLVQALDFYQRESQENSGKKITGRFAEFKPVKLENISEEDFPPCIKKILEGISDGKKRAVFILIGVFRSIGMEKGEMEKRIFEWNRKNEVPLKEGYIQAQLSWAYRRKPVLPPNCKEFYQNMGVCQPDDFCKMIKNPVNYVIRKNSQRNKKSNKFKNKK